jgi:hypothetical protein
VLAKFLERLYYLFIHLSCPVFGCQFSLIVDLLFFFLQLGHGDFSAANTKVLRMVNTLTVDNEAKQTIEALQNELQKTKEKLKAVEELKSQSGKTPCKYS